MTDEKLMNVPQSLGVLITYYNEKEMLTECLDSLFSDPNCTPEEVLVYDDASQYPAEHYIPKDRSVRVIRGASNRGPAHGRNELLKANRSDYIHFHDSDDLFMKHWCSELKKAIHTSQADMVLTEITSYKHSKLYRERVIGLKKLKPDSDIVSFCIRNNLLTDSGTYRKAAVLKVGGYRESLWQSEDYDFHIRMAASVKSFFVIYEPMVIIRVREESRSAAGREVWSCALNSIQLLSEEIPAKYYPDLSWMAHFTGSKLFKLGETRKAREAFKLSYRLGTPDYSDQRWMYCVTAKIFGPEIAERLGAFYRAILPQTIRRFFRAWH